MFLFVRIFEKEHSRLKASMIESWRGLCCGLLRGGDGRGDGAGHLLLQQKVFRVHYGASHRVKGDDDEDDDGSRDRQLPCHSTVFRLNYLL